MRIVTISDTHGRHAGLKLPPGELLIHAGDVSQVGEEREVEDFLEWFGAQPHPHKVLIAGNHDFMAERDPEAWRARVPANVRYLQDEACEVEGLKLYGSPWTPLFFDWAFMLPRGELLRNVWAKIPADTDVLITHGPPTGQGDLVPPSIGPYPRAVGCLELLKVVQRVRPRLHVFGHIHEGYGVTQSDEVPFTLFANTSTCNLAYEPLNPPLVFELTPERAMATRLKE